MKTTMDRVRLLVWLGALLVTMVTLPTTTAASNGLVTKTITYDNGDRYHGQTRAGKLHGHGVYTWSSGTRYEGDFVDGKHTGHGAHTWPDGARYEGEFRDGQLHGLGRYTYTDDSVKEGEWLNGEIVPANSRSTSITPVRQPAE